MTASAPGTIRRDARPPIEMEAAPFPGAVRSSRIRLTAVPRPWIRPVLIGPPVAGMAPDDPAVRRFWTALIGPGAVADLLRLTAAARAGRKVRRPVHLAELLAEGLVLHDGSAILVHRDVPPLSPGHLRRLRPALRVEYRRALAS